MKHVILGHGWEFRDIPYPGYYAPDGKVMNWYRSFLLLVKIIKPMRTFQVTAQFDGAMLYYGGDEQAAYRIKREFDSWQSDPSHYAYLSYPCDTLAQDRFRIYRSPYEGLLIDEGGDSTDRCLLFFYGTSDHTEEVEIDFRFTNAPILSSQYARNSVKVEMHGVALLEKGQWVVLRSWHNGQRETTIHSWNGSIVITKKLRSNYQPKILIPETFHVEQPRELEAV